MINSIKNQKGFSLIGTLVAVAIFGIIASGTTALFDQILTSQQTQRFRMEFLDFNKEIRAILSNRNACTSTLNSIAGLNLNNDPLEESVQAILDKDGADYIRATNQFQGSIVTLNSINFVTAAPPAPAPPVTPIGTGVLRLEFTTQSKVYGAKTVIREISLQTVKNTGSGALIECIALSEMTDGIWNIGTENATIDDVYFLGGNVGINTSNPNDRLDVNGTATIRGNTTVQGDVIATNYFHSSDRRLKKDIETSKGLDLILRLRGAVYNWIDSGKPSGGVIAQEVEQVMPHAVRTGADGKKAVDYDAITGPLIESIKELHAQVEELNQRIIELESQQKVNK